MIPFALILAALIPLGSIAWDMWREDHRVTPAVVVAKHRAEDRIVVAPAEPLPQRPDGLAALKEEIRESQPTPLDDVTPAVVPLVGELHLRPAVPRWHESEDWKFDSGEFRIAWDDWFDGQPEDQAVIRPWAGVGVKA